MQLRLVQLGLAQLGLAGALATTLALAPAAQAAEPSAFTLENGLQVLVLEDHRAPVAVQFLWYRVGAADEPAGKSGIAHFLEHLMFQGTETMAAGQLSQEVARQGGTDNAFTTQDYTAYFQRVAADRLPLMMEMEAERMRHLRLSEEDVLTERQVILEERAQRTDSSPQALFSEQMAAAQFLNSPYGIPVIGWKHEMEGLTREDALAFYRRFYAPNNAILIVGGDVEPEEVLELARTHYGPLEPTPDLAPRLRPQEPPQLAARRLAMSDPRVAQPLLLRQYLAPQRRPGDQRRAAALQLLALLLGDSPTTSVLGRALQVDSGTAVWSSAWYGGTSLDAATFGLYLVPADGVGLPAAEAALDQVLDGFLQDGIDPDQWERIRFQLKAAQIYEDDSITAQVRKYGSALTSGLTLADVAEWPLLLQDVTPEEVMEAARALLVPEHSVTGWLTPEPVAVFAGPDAGEAADEGEQADGPEETGAEPEAVVPPDPAAPDGAEAAPPEGVAPEETAPGAEDTAAPGETAGEAGATSADGEGPSEAGDAPDTAPEPTPAEAGATQQDEPASGVLPEPASEDADPDTAPAAEIFPEAAPDPDTDPPQESAPEAAP